MNFLQTPNPTTTCITNLAEKTVPVQHSSQLARCCNSPLDPLLKHGHVLVRQAADHLVQPLPLLEVGLRHGVQRRTPHRIIPVRNLFGQLAQRHGWLSTAHPQTRDADQSAHLLQTLGPLLGVLRSQTVHQEDKQLGGGIQPA